MGNASTTICIKPSKKILSLWISTLSLPKSSLPLCPFQLSPVLSIIGAKLMAGVVSHGQPPLAPEGDMVRDLRLEEHLQADFKHLPVLCPEDSSLPSSSASQPSCTRLTRPFHNSLLSLRHFLERLHLPHAQPWGRGSPLYFYHVFSFIVHEVPLL